jgi:uncharacterized membrane protein
MSKRTRWLSSEIDRWTSSGIVTDKQAADIRSLYRDPTVETSTGLLVFSGIGAVVVGLGVILLFAHNWHAIPKFGKLALIFGVLLAAHAGGLHFRAKIGWRRQLGEALCILGTMAFGAGIWLVAQIYNIDEHFPDGFLLWGLGALGMAWALRSVPQALMATVLLTIWDGSERFTFDTPRSMAPVLVVLGLCTLAWRLRSALLATFVLASLYLILIFDSSFLESSYGAWQSVYALSVLLVALAGLAREGAVTAAQRGVMASFGVTGFFFCSFLRSFRYFDGWLFQPSAESASPGDWHRALGAAYVWIPVGLALGTWLALQFRRVTQARGWATVGDWIYPIALTYSMIFSAAGVGGHGFLDNAYRTAHAGYTSPFIIFNLVCLTLAITWMVRGCRYGNAGQTVMGSLFFATVILARYFDLPGSLASRGLVFILLGAVLFAEGFFYRKLRREPAGEDEP